MKIVSEKRVAAMLANDLMHVICGQGVSSPKITRLELKSGRMPNERSEGGLNRAAVRGRIIMALRRHGFTVLQERR